MCHDLCMTDELIGAREASELLGIDRSTLTRWVSSGRIVPVTKMPGASGAYLFHRSDVEALRDNGDHEPGAA